MAKSLSQLASQLDPARFRAATLTSANKLGASIQARTRMRLSGRVLNRRSGDLWNSVKYSVTERGNSVEVEISAGEGLKYARIHEFGGTIRPKNPAGLLRFKIGGDWVFAKKVKMPKRPYFFPSVHEVWRQFPSILRADMRAALDGD